MKIHCHDCCELLGGEFAEVHRFLDQYAKDLPPPVFFDYHRSLLHNSYGLAVIRARWERKHMRPGEFILLAITMMLALLISYVTGQPLL